MHCAEALALECLLRCFQGVGGLLIPMPLSTSLKQSVDSAPCLHSAQLANKGGSS